MRRSTRTSARTLAAHVVREAGRASRLIDDMLLMARVDRGLELALAPADLGAVVRIEADRRGCVPPTCVCGSWSPTRPSR